MVGRVLGNRTSQLGDFDFVFVVTLEAGENYLAKTVKIRIHSYGMNQWHLKISANLPRTRLQSIHHARNRTFVIHVAEQYQLLVDEILVRNASGVLRVQVVFAQTQFLSPFGFGHPTG